jgi:hypothetical protein
MGNWVPAYVGEVEEGLQDGEDDGRVVELQSVLEHVQDIVQIVLGGRMPQRLWPRDRNDDYRNSEIINK